MGRGTKGDRVLAEAALIRVRALLDITDESSCRVPEEHKEGVRLYVQSWVEPLLDALVEHLNDGVPIPQYLLDDARSRILSHKMGGG